MKKYPHIFSHSKLSILSNIPQIKWNLQIKKITKLSGDAPLVISIFEYFFIPISPQGNFIFLP